MVLAALGTVFAAAYLLWLYQRTAFGDADRRSSPADGHAAHAVGAAVNDDTTTTAPTSTTSPSSSGSPGRRCWS